MQPRIVIIGAGFGGIAAAVYLLKAGMRDVTILDRAQQVGGVWQVNDYPGCACDIPAPLYSYSFALHPGWSRRFPPRAEIQAYLEDVVDRFGLRDRLRLGTGVEEARYDERSCTWTLRTAAGQAVECDLLVCAVGQLSEPKMPDIPGLASFGGVAVHSALWSGDIDVDGAVVGVVGTGASAIQIVPALADRAAAKVIVFQRSAPWTLPKPDRRYGAARRALYRRVPATMRLSRAATWALTSVMGRAVTGHRLAAAAVQAVSDGQRRVQVRDQALRERVTPDHAMGCKRVLFTSSWFPALQRPTVELVTDAIREVSPAGVVTADGREHPVDILVLGTGFAATELVTSVRVIGRCETELGAVWREGAHAYLGMTLPGFPNFFVVYGPNTNTGNSSVVYFHEAQARYIAQAARLLAATRGGALEVRAQVESGYDQEIQARLRASVWSTCTSWYRSASGRVITNWPGMAGEYARRTAQFRIEDYVLSPPRGAR